MQKIEAGSYLYSIAEFDVGVLVTTAIENNQTYADEYSVHITNDLKLDKAFIMVDEKHFQQAMNNLLSNAVKFSPNKGEVVVSSIRNDAYIRITVTDSGPGIPDQYHPHMFEKFTQADSSNLRKHGGTGLGLSITKSIVDKMNGNIGFDTEMGVGTTFYIEFSEHMEAGGTQSDVGDLQGAREVE